MKFWKMILNKAKDTAEILIYEQIGKDYWSDEGIAAKDFAADLKAMGDVKNITVRLNSPGGSVFEGNTIYNLLKAHQATVTVYIDGIAASIASVIAMAGDKIIMPENALIMIHDPWSMVAGTADDMRKMAEALDKIKESLKTSYKRSMMTDEEITQMMTDETWMTAQEALDKGFCDEVITAVKVAASFDLSQFRKAPQAAALPITGASPAPKITTTPKEVKNMDKCTKCGTDLVNGQCPACQAAAKAVSDFRASEKERAAEIRAMGKKFNCPDVADKFIDEGKSIDEMKTEVLNRLHSEPPIDTVSDLLGSKEKKEYSYARAMNAAVNIAMGLKVNSLEVEVSNEIAKRAPVNMTNHGGIYIPVVKNAGLDSHTSTAGTEMVFTQYGGEIIQTLRNMSVCAGLGARILTGLTSPVSFPKVTSEGAAAWVAENPGSDGSDTDDATDVVTLTPRGLTRSTAISRMLLTTSVGDAEGMIRDSISAAIALAIDKAGIHGSGSANQPTGIYAAGDVNAKAMGGVPTFAKLIDMITEVAKDNAILGTLGWATTPGMAGKLMQTLVASAAGSAMIWNGKINDGLLCGYKSIASNQVSSVMTGSTTTGGSEHGIVFGNWADLLIAMFGGLEIVVDPYALKKQAMIEYTIYGMADVALRHGQSFCKSTGATIA